MDFVDGLAPRLPADRLAGMLVGVGATSGPLHRRLSEGLAELIDRGELPPLAVLPSERALAAALTMSRTTVVTAYETLRRSGRLERRRGSGTRVSAPRDRPSVSGSLLSGEHAATPFLDGPRATIDFTVAALPSLDVVADVASGLNRDDYLLLTRAQHGYDLRGSPALRDRIARWYTENGAPTTPDEILVTSGAQQALDLVARGCLQPGDRVVVESPTYRGALETFARTGSRLRPVRCDAGGLDVADLERLVAGDEVRLVYVQAGAHNPTGAVLSAGRRRRLAELVGTHDLVLVDDTSLARTVFDGPPAPPALGSHDRLITIGSLSKLFWGGLRLGWIRASAQVTTRLARVRGLTDLGTSPVTQEIALRLFDHEETAMAERRRQLQAGLRTLTGLLAEHLPGWTWQPPRAGASLWVRMPHGDATRLAQVALRYGVALLPGAAHSRDGSAGDYTRLPYALPAATLTSGVARLGEAWRHYAERAAGDASVRPSSSGAQRFHSSARRA